MQHDASKRLRTAHLALAAVALLGAIAVVLAALRPAPSLDLPTSYGRAAWIAIAAALLYLLACSASEWSRYRRGVAASARPTSMLWLTVGVEAMLVLAAATVLIRGHTSRGLLARLDVLLPAVVVVAVLAIAIAVATRRNDRQEVGLFRGAWQFPAAIVRCLAAAVLVVTLVYLEVQTLPNSLVQ